MVCWNHQSDEEICWGIHLWNTHKQACSFLVLNNNQQAQLHLGGECWRCWTLCVKTLLDSLFLIEKNRSLSLHTSVLNKVLDKMRWIRIIEWTKWMRGEKTNPSIFIFSFINTSKSSFTNKPIRRETRRRVLQIREGKDLHIVGLEETIRCCNHLGRRYEMKNRSVLETDRRSSVNRRRLCLCQSIRINGLLAFQVIGRVELKHLRGLGCEEWFASVGSSSFLFVEKVRRVMSVLSSSEQCNHSCSEYESTYSRCCYYKSGGQSLVAYSDSSWVSVYTAGPWRWWGSSTAWPTVSSSADQESKENRLNDISFDCVQ